MPETKDTSPQFSTPEKVRLVCDNMQTIERDRAFDRARIDALANGNRPYTADEVKKFQIQINVNWGFLGEKVRAATSQINNAFIPAGNFFTAHSQGGEINKRLEYGQKFTKNINHVLKRGDSGKKHHYILRSRNASVSLHGIGPLMWTTGNRLLPRYVPLEDLLIPSETLIDLSTNLTYFAVNLYMTAGELYRMGCVKPTLDGWNETAVKNILKDLKSDQNIPAFNSTNASDWNDRPEAIQELWKQNRGFLESDAAPKVKLRAFYFQDPETQKWYRKIVLRDSTPSQESEKVFIFDGKAPFAEKLGHMLQMQYGDNSLVPPLKHHSVRGIGTLLYAPAETLNRLTCQGVQHVFQNLLTWFKINDPTDRDRLKQIILSQYGVMPEGASIVPQTERHQIDPRLLEFGMAQMKQNIAENSTSFTQGVDSGTRKEMTAFEARARLQSANAMVSNVLQMMYAQEIFYYEEIVRRALKKNTDDPTAKKFQESCKRDGIPDELMTPENWRIVADRVLGAGDNMLAQAQADQLMSQKNTFEPDAQRKIQHMWTSTLTENPDLADELVPPQKDDTTSGTRTAEDLYATLMRGIAIPLRKGIDQIGYCSALLQMMDVEIQKILQTDGMGTPEQINGFVTIATNVEQTLQFIAQDVKNKPIVKQLNDLLGKSLNEVKGMAQRHSEQNAEQQPDPESSAKAQAIQMQAGVKAETSQMLAEVKRTITETNNAIKNRQKEEAFQQKQRQQWEAHQQEMAKKSQTTEADILAMGVKTGAAVAAQKVKADAAPDKS